MDYQTNEQLSEMRLHAMRLEYRRQQELPAMQDLSFDERFSMIVMEQYNARCEAKFNRLIRAAKLREPGASLSNIDFVRCGRSKNPPFPTSQTANGSGAGQT